MPAPVTLGVVEECIPALRRYAAVLLLNPQDQDALVHDCLVRALDHRHTRREDASLRSWLFAIMHNLLVRQLRKKKLGGEVTPIDTVRDERYRIAADQERYVEIRDVFQAPKCLPEEQRSALVLISVEDLAYAEAAQVLEIPVGTLMSRLPSKTLHRGNRGSDHLSPHSGAANLLLYRCSVHRTKFRKRSVLNEWSASCS